MASEWRHTERLINRDQGALMSRQILANQHIHPAIQPTIAENHADIVAEVQAAVANNKVVVVGMAQNPAPKNARKIQIGLSLIPMMKGVKCRLPNSLIRVLVKVLRVNLSLCSSLHRKPKFRLTSEQ